MVIISFNIYDESESGLQASGGLEPLGDRGSERHQSIERSDIRLGLYV